MKLNEIPELLVLVASLSATLSLYSGFLFLVWGHDE